MEKARIPFFKKADLDASIGVFFDGFSKVIVAIAILAGTFGLDSGTIFGTMMPGMVLTVVVLNGGLWLYYRGIAAKRNDPNLTAIPAGLQAGRMFIWLYSIMLPVFLSTGNAELAFKTGVLAHLVGGIVFIEPLMRAFGASDASLSLAEDYAFWMFVAALANLPAQSMNCAARAESSVKISSIAVITGALLNVVLDPIFMFDWGLGMGVEGASLATTVSQFVTFFILAWFYLSGRSVIKLHLGSFRPSWKLIKTVTVIGVPTAVIQICLSVASSLTNIAAAPLPDADNIIAAYGVVQRLILIGCYVVMGFMQGYQPVASYAFGAKQEERFHQSVRFALKGSLILTVLVAAAYILLSRPLILLFNQNPVIVDCGRWLLISQVALYPAFGLCYMMTITYQTIGASGYGLFLSMIRQGLFYVPFILVLPRLLGVTGIYLTQPAADLLTILVCLCSIRSMKQIASANMNRLPEGD